jgi:hypothetical protein
MKNRTKIIVIVSVLIIVFLSLRNCSCNRTKTAPKPIITGNNYRLTNPPLPELDLPYQKFEIDPSQPNVLYSKKGAKINIPKDAFLDKEGNVIKDKVEITFREFYNPLDFYLAGIPMEYNDNGVQKVLESAGMVELNAKSDNNELFVNPSNKIKVDLYSWTKSKDFNLYDLDKTTGKWIEKGKDLISTLTEKGELNALPPIPLEPKVATRASFSLIDDTKMYPEIELYKNVRFEPINVSECKISDAQEMRLKFLKDGKVEVTSILKYGTFRKENTCLCYLAFEPGKDYNDALLTYQKKYAKILKERVNISDRIKKELDDYNAFLDNYRKLQFNLMSGQEKIIRTLEINNFGFVNSDYAINFPTEGEINPIYIDKNGEPIVLNNVVLVELNTNTIIRYSSTIKYNPKEENILWGMTDDNKLAYLKKGDFRSLRSTSSKQKVQMHIYGDKLNSSEDIMKVLF